MARLYYGSYGHHPSGKQYVYIGSDNHRTGENVVAPVTHYISGKNYNTMFTIMRTSGIESPMAQNELERLAQNNIKLKSIENESVLDLPSGWKYPSAAAWKRASDEKYYNEPRITAKDRLYEPVKPNPNPIDTEAKDRLTTDKQWANKKFIDRKKYQFMDRSKFKFFNPNSSKYKFMTIKDKKLFDRSKFDFTNKEAIEQYRKHIALVEQLEKENLKKEALARIRRVLW